MKQLYVVALCALLSCLPLSAQDTTEIFSVGGFVGYNLNLHSADFKKLPNIPNNSSGFTSGSGSGFALGGLLEYPLSPLLRLQLRASYASLSGEMTTQENPGNQLNFNNPDNITVEDIIIEHRMRGNLNAIMVEPALSIHPWKHLSFQVGAALGFLAKNEFEQEEVVLQPASVTFLNNRSVMNDTSGTMPGDKSMYMAAIAGVSYELSAGKNSTLIPSLRYYLPFGDIASVPWKVSVIQFSAALRTAIISTPPIPVIQDTVYIRDTTTTVIAGLTEERVTRTNSASSMAELRENGAIVERTTIRESYSREIPRSFTLSSTLALSGILANGQRVPNPSVTIEETEVQETFPLLPYVFFAPNSAELSSTRLKVLSAQQARQFKADELPADALGIYTYNLNIIGMRLRDNPSATITITGCNNNTGAEKNNTALSQARAEVVRDYLVNVWGVNARQITLKSRSLPEKAASNDVEDGQVENRRAEISTSSYDILKPVSIGEISKAATPPVVSMLPTVQAEGGVARWELVLKQGSRTLRQFTGEGDPSERRWQVMESPIPESEEDVTATLSAVDQSGQRTTASKSLAVRQLTISKKRSEVKDDKRIEIFSLILFDFDKSDLSPVNQKIMNEVKQRIAPTSTVTVYGYADRTGGPDYNRELAGRRCAEVAKYLGNAVAEGKLTVNAVGSDKLLHNNDLPEGRSYSRTVQIVIETPVQ